jgi:putative aminopeptidase FrvX
MSQNMEVLPYLPEIEPALLALLEKLCLACAVSGDEGEVRRIVLEELKTCPVEVKVDALGNVLVTRRGRVEDLPRVMLAAHMDEVGFILVNDDEGGFFQFALVGGIDVRSLLGKPVVVGHDHLPGVIGAKPIHLTTREELEHVVPLESLRIDLGPEGKAKVGDWAVFAPHFSRQGPSLCAKALDDRLGVAALITLVKYAPDNIDLLAAFTVQEEVGVRGAGVAGYAFNPDLAIAVDSTPANDLPAWDGSENIAYNTRLGLGPAIYLADRGTLSDQRLVKHLVSTAEANHIPFQYRQPGGGGTDASSIHLQRSGIPSLSVSIPGRYPHTRAGLARIDDWLNTIRLLHAALLGCDTAFVSSLLSPGS